MHRLARVGRGVQQADRVQPGRDEADGRPRRRSRLRDRVSLGPDPGEGQADQRRGAKRAQHKLHAARGHPTTVVSARLLRSGRDTRGQSAGGEQRQEDVVKARAVDRHPRGAGRRRGEPAQGGADHGRRSVGGDPEKVLPSRARPFPIVFQGSAALALSVGADTRSVRKSSSNKGTRSMKSWTVGGSGQRAVGPAVADGPAP